MERVSATAPKLVHLRTLDGVPCFGVWDDTNKECDTKFAGHRSIGNPAESANPGLLAAGALGFFQFPDERPYCFLEPISSLGPTTDGWVKPDITGIGRLARDGTYTGPDGTSYASSAIAGLAALVLDRYASDSSYDTPAEVAAYLKEQATDLGTFDSEGNLLIGTVGPDNRTGYGLGVLPDPDEASDPIATPHLSTASISEAPPPSGPAATLNVTLDKPAANNITFRITGTSSGAYTLSEAVPLIAFDQGEITSDTPITITSIDNSDDAADLDVTFSSLLTLSALVSGLESVTLTIVDDDGPPRAHLSLAHSTVSERTPSLNVTVRLDKPLDPAAASAFAVAVPDSGYTLHAEP